MKGYIISHKSEEKKDIISNNHYLFGKITSVRSKKYYYRGLLHDIMYKKLSGGCYFITIPGFDRERFNCYAVEIDITEGELITARQKWTMFAEGKKIFVRNLNAY